MSSITTIGGKRCTAVPKGKSKAAAGGGGAAAAATGQQQGAQEDGRQGESPATSLEVAKKTSPSPAAQNTPTTTPITAAPAVNSITTPSPTPTPPSTAIPESVAPTTSIAPAAAPTTAIPEAAPTTVPPAAATEAPIVPADSSAAETSTETNPSPTSASSTVDAATSSSPQGAPIVQSEIIPSSTGEPSSTDIHSTTFTTPISSPTSAAPVTVETSASTGISSNNHQSAGSAVGGIMGGIAAVLILSFLWWAYKRRQARNSTLTPLTPQSFQKPSSDASFEKYEIDNESLGPTARGQMWRAQAGGLFGTLREKIQETSSSLQSKFGRSKQMSVNMNRGNSQFIEAVPQYSRNASSIGSASRGSEITKRDKFRDWISRFTEDVNFNWRLRNLMGKKPKEDSHFSVPSVYNPTAGSSEDPGLTNYLAMKENELRDTVNQPRRPPWVSRAGMTNNLISYSTSDPFADPFSSDREPTIPNLTTDPQILTFNPFQDPPMNNKRRSSSASDTTPANYIANIRRSRGHSVSNPNTSKPSQTTQQLPGQVGSRYPSTMTGGIASRYPSTIVTNRSHDSFRSSTFTMNPRKKAGRSDPFDLDSLMLGTPAPPTPAEYPPRTTYVTTRRNSGLSRISQSPTSSIGAMGGSDRVSENKGPHLVSVNAKGRILSATGTYSSKYSSVGSGIISEWGDPGPDIGPGSGVNRYANHNAQIEEMDRQINDLRRGESGRSPEPGVGKAM